MYNSIIRGYRGQDRHIVKRAKIDHNTKHWRDRIVRFIALHSKRSIGSNLSGVRISLSPQNPPSPVRLPRVGEQ